MPLVFSSKRFNLRGVLLCAALSLLVRETAASATSATSSADGKRMYNTSMPVFKPPAEEKLPTTPADKPADDEKVSPMQPYGYTSMVQPENPEEAKCDAIAQLTNASAEDAQGNTVGVQTKFASLANGFQQIPQLINDLAAAFNAKLQGMVNNVNAAFASMNTNVNSVVNQVQTDAHGKRGAVITHVNTEGTKAQTVINALQTAQNGLINARAAAEAERQQANADAEKVRAEKDTIVTQKLD